MQTIDRAKNIAEFLREHQYDLIRIPPDVRVAIAETMEDLIREIEAKQEEK